MANDGQIVFEVVADASRAKADIKDVTKTIQNETKKWDDAAKSSTDNIASSFSSMLKTLGIGFSAAKVGKALLDLGKQAIQAASDLSEVQNVVDVTFGESANQIETWAKKANTQFGLTETQAKRFTSTMGAMLKSSGMAGSQIVEVSTDLAGLAADMASFYNLDFDTAFAKIRSGISGETMPLKELGIDMSVATLNAFALQKGLTKTFDQMSQGEKTMLRYQYLMQATADAQGDFARTSDGYANGMRALESQMETIKANIGNTLLPVVEAFVSDINKLFASDTGEEKKRTILDDLADVDANTEKNVQRIVATKIHVEELSKALEDIAGGKTRLDAATENISGAVSGVSELAQKLNTVSFEGGAKEAFEGTLSILRDNVDALSEIKGESAEGVTTWLNNVAEQAKTLSPEDAQAWATLTSALVADIPGMDGTEDGQQFTEKLAQQFLAMGSDSAEAAKGLAALGYGTEEIEERQSAWLATCRELVRVMPGLADIINTQTGEVKGGIPAIREYADEWERTAKYEAELRGLAEKREIVAGAQTEIDIKNKMNNAWVEARAMLISYGKLTDEQADKVLAGAKRMAEASYAGFDVNGYGKISYSDLKDNPWLAAQQFYGGEFDSADFVIDEKAFAPLGEYMQDLYDLQEFYELQPIYTEQIEKAQEKLGEEYGKTAEEIEAEAEAARAAAREMSTLEKAANGDAEAMTTVTDAVTNANNALKEMTDYAEGVHKSIRNAIDSTVGKMDFLGNAAMRQEKKLEPLEKELKALTEGTEAYKLKNEEIQKVTADSKDIYGVGNAKKNLESQLAFLKEYKEDMEKAQAAGFSDEFLAQFADGSLESAEWLHELAGASDEDAKELSKLYKDITSAKEGLTDTLSQQQLSVDETFKSLAEKAKESVAALDLGESAYQNAGKTIEELARGIGDHVPDVQTQVQAIIDQLNRLDGWGIDIDFGGFGNINIKTSAGRVETSARMGLFSVPHDDYIARLHEGERVLSAQEAQKYNTLLYGGYAGFDLDSLGGVMRDNIKAGGNVYLDGKAVGTVVSDRQGRSYKSLQRSGWQA